MYVVHMGRFVLSLFVPHLFFFFGTSRGLCLVNVAFPGYLQLHERTTQSSKENRTNERMKIEQTNNDELQEKYSQQTEQCIDFVMDVEAEINFFFTDAQPRITKTCLFMYIENFTSTNFQEKYSNFSYYCSKHRL